MHTGGITVAIGDLPAGDEIDLVFTIRTAPGAVGDLLPMVVTACWTDPRADARRETDASPPPLRRATRKDVADAAPDGLVAERAVLQRASAERRAGLELDRTGRFHESRVRMLLAQDMLMASPMTDEVRASVAETAALASLPPTDGYGSHVRKTAQFQESLRRRGRLHRSVEDQDQ